LEKIVILSREAVIFLYFSRNRPNRLCKTEVKFVFTLEVLLIISTTKDGCCVILSGYSSSHHELITIVNLHLDLLWRGYCVRGQFFLRVDQTGGTWGRGRSCEGIAQLQTLIILHKWIEIRGVEVDNIGLLNHLSGALSDLLFTLENLRCLYFPHHLLLTTCLWALNCWVNGLASTGVCKDIIIFSSY
jgi:hypothetical protein